MSTLDYFTSRSTSTSALRTRPPPTVHGVGTPGSPRTPRTPRTPILQRSISSQYGSPGSYRVEQEEYLVYELGARHLSAGFAGESRPRRVVRFDPDGARRAGDYRQYDPDYARMKRRKTRDWGDGYELYRADLRKLDLALVEDKLERALRRIHLEHLQLDTKPRKVLLAVPSLLPAPLLEVVLKVLFNHQQQPPSVTMMTNPILACVGAGLRNALVIDVGWEETVVTAVGEYKEIHQRRSVRAGKALTREMGTMLDEEARNAEQHQALPIDFAKVEEVTGRLGWCKPLPGNPETGGSAENHAKSIPLPVPDGPITLSIPFERLSDPAESALFAGSDLSSDSDDHELPLHSLAYRVLLALPTDLRAMCVSRIVVTGGVSLLPSLKQRLLYELERLVEKRGWDPVHHYGSASPRTSGLPKRLGNIVRQPADIPDRSDNTTPRPVDIPDRSENTTPRQSDIVTPHPPPRIPSPTKRQEAPIPHRERKHDDVNDPISRKAERATREQEQPVKGVVRGVETLGAWAGASLVASLRVKGVREVEREEFLKHGLRDGGAVY